MNPIVRGGRPDSRSAAGRPGLAPGEDTMPPKEVSQLGGLSVRPEVRADRGAGPSRLLPRGQDRAPRGPATAQVASRFKGFLTVHRFSLLKKQEKVEGCAEN